MSSSSDLSQGFHVSVGEVSLFQSDFKCQFF